MRTNIYKIIKKTHVSASAYEYMYKYTDLLELVGVFDYIIPLQGNNLVINNEILNIHGSVFCLDSKILKIIIS